MLFMSAVLMLLHRADIVPASQPSQPEGQSVRPASQSPVFFQMAHGAPPGPTQDSRKSFPGYPYTKHQTLLPWNFQDVRDGSRMPFTQLREAFRRFQNVGGGPRGPQGGLLETSKKQQKGPFRGTGSMQSLPDDGKRKHAELECSSSISIELTLFPIVPMTCLH